MRLFIAVNLSGEVKGRLAALSGYAGGHDKPRQTAANDVGASPFPLRFHPNESAIRQGPRARRGPETWGRGLVSM